MQVADDSPLVLALSEDLFLIPRLADAARDLGFRFEVIDSPAAVNAEGPAIERSIPLTEPLRGPDAQFMRAIVDLQPALVLVDTSSSALPWERWIRTLKTAAATRRMPIVAFGPHVEKQALMRAREAGAEEAVSRGRLQASLAEILQRRARRIDRSALNEACNGALSELGREGLRLLNAGDFYEAHEAFEAAWIQAPELDGYLYRALLQIAVACLQVERANYAGTVKMLLRLRQWLEPLPDRCKDVNVAGLKLKIADFSQAVEAAGPQGIGDLTATPIPVELGS